MAGTDKPGQSEQFPPKSDAYPEQEEWLVSSDIQALDQKFLAQGQPVDPIADTEGQANAFFFQYFEQPGLVISLAAGICSIRIGYAGLVQESHSIQAVPAALDIRCNPGRDQFCIAGVGIRMQAYFHESGV